MSRRACRRASCRLDDRRIVVVVVRARLHHPPPRSRRALPVRPARTPRSLVGDVGRGRTSRAQAQEGARRSTPPRPRSARSLPAHRLPPPPPRAPPPTFSRLPVALGRYRRDRLDPALSPPPRPPPPPSPPHPSLSSSDPGRRRLVQARRSGSARHRRRVRSRRRGRRLRRVRRRGRRARPLQPHSCNVLLHLCAGGVATAGGYGAPSEASPRQSPVPSRAEVHPERANAVFNHMVAENVPRTR